MRLSLPAICLLAALAMPLGACQSGSNVEANMPVYPAHEQRSELLDIHAVRDGTSISLTNSTAKSFGPGRLWINQWYSRPIDGLSVGQTLTIPLAEFRDTYGEAFRAGGFFATQKPESISLLELECETKIYSFVAITAAE